MSKPNIHTTYNTAEKNWRNISEGATRPMATYPTKQEAVAAGREIAMQRHVEQLIHDKNGQIKDRNSYGHDPRNIKG
jgi:hypothetical protein